MINIFQQLISSLVLLLSMSTLLGVLLHDTGVDKVITSSFQKTSTSDISPDAVNTRASSNLHPHAEHMNVKKDGREPAMQPRKRVRKDMASRRVMRGYHGDGVCMPLAGEWI